MVWSLTKAELAKLIHNKNFVFPAHEIDKKRRKFI